MMASDILLDEVNTITPTPNPYDDGDDNPDQDNDDTPIHDNDGDQADVVGKMKTHNEQGIRLAKAVCEKCNKIVNITVTELRTYLVCIECGEKVVYLGG